MAMKVKTNLKKKKGTSVKSSNPDNPSVANTEKNPSYNVRQISNGWIVSKSWTDAKDKYHSEEIYHKDKPIDESLLEDDGEDNDD